MKNIFAYITLSTAVTISIIAAYYSIFGLSKLFASQAEAVIAMASILEFSKLVVASFLHQYWKYISLTRKLYLSISVFILMCITSIGIYGFLVSAYQDTARKMSVHDQNVSIKRNEIAKYETKINQLKTSYEQLSEDLENTNLTILKLSESLSNNVIQYRNSAGDLITTQSADTRKIINDQLRQENVRRDTLISKQSKIQDIQTSLLDSISFVELDILNIESNNDAAAEIGPLLYVSSITGYPIELVVNWFILLFILVFDPLALILLVSSQTILNLRPVHIYEPLENDIEDDEDDDIDVENKDDLLTNETNTPNMGTGRVNVVS